MQYIKKPKIRQLAKFEREIRPANKTTSYIIPYKIEHCSIENVVFYKMIFNSNRLSANLVFWGVNIVSMLCKLRQSYICHLICTLITPALGRFMSTSVIKNEH